MKNPVMGRHLSSEKNPVMVRKVWSHNLRDELNLIASIIGTHRFAAMDMEFPGNIFKPAVEKHQLNSLSSDVNYSFMKSNVDLLKPIQLGLALSDPHGNLPNFGAEKSYVWEFNFRDFDPTRDPYNLDSVILLRRQGINFAQTREFGIDSWEFRRMVFETGLVSMFPQLSWVTFQSSYDFGYMIKLLTGENLPDQIGGFMGLVRNLFGVHIYDVKHVMKFCDGLYGGLEKVASSLGVDRVVGTSHQAGSDSVLTLQTFLKLRDTYFGGDKRVQMIRLGGVIHGLGFIRMMMVANYPPMGVRVVVIGNYNCPSVMAA